MEKTKKKKAKHSWIKLRHRIITAIGAPVLYPFTRMMYGVTIDKFKAQRDRQYLILLNHQTVFDQFFVSMAFRGPIYYLATEDIFSNGWVSRLISWLVAPIPIKKQTTDMTAVKTCIRVAREGGTIAIAPEGNRTYSGRTVYIKPSIVKLTRALKMPIAIFRIEGGYGVQPRWSDKLRKGRMHAGVSRVLEPEEYKDLSDDQLYDLICQLLYVDEASVSGNFYHKKNAEYLERAMYVCPDCGLSVFRSKNDLVTCTKCGKQIRYLPSKELEGVGFQFPFRFVGTWYDYQCDFVRSLDLTAYKDQPLYRDTARMSEVILYKNKSPMTDRAFLTLCGDRITVRGEGIEDMVFPFDQCGAVTVLGRNKLNIYFGDRVYQFKGDKSFNALKYVNLYHHYKNTSEGNTDGKFLGL